MNAEPPVKGMKQLPYGWDDPLLCEAFMSCVSWAASVDKIMDAFTKHTGTDMRSLFAKAPEKRTVVHRDAFVKFCDFVAEFVWGLEDPQ